MNLLRNKIKRSAIACLSVTLCISLTAGCAGLDTGKGRGDGTTATTSLSFTDVTDKFDTTNLTTQNFNSSVIENTQPVYETRTVIVALNGSCILDLKNGDVSVSDYLQTSEGQSALREIDREQKTFLNKLTSQGIKYSLKSTYSTITNAVAIEVNTSYVSRIKGFGGVSSACIAQTYLAPKTVTSADGGYTATENDANVYATGIYDSSDYDDTSVYPWGKGDGVVVAIVDTGLDYTHEAFQTMPEKPAFTKSGVADKMSQTTFEAAKRTALSGGTLTADDVYVSDKVPFAYDYADNDADVYPSYSNHGTHVAGIVAGYNEDGYDDKDGNHVSEAFVGVAPNAQLVICKTFTDNLDDSALGGAESENIMSALEDCVNLGVDVINMSLGTTAGFTSTNDGDEEGDLYDTIFKNIQKEGISLICAASNDYSAGFGSVYGTNLASNPDSGTVGSPSTYYAALSVASISGQKSDYLAASDGSAIFIENASNGNAVEYDFVDLVLGRAGKTDVHEFEYVDVGLGQQSNYRGKDVEGKIVLIKRGLNTFQEKIELAAAQGAVGALVWNNVSGTIKMSLGDAADENFIPAASITMDAGNKLIELTDGNGVGKITVNKSLVAGPFMSSFSSWGPTPDLKIKPEITAHGGEITSTVPGGYAEQSGTSMAAPNMAGLTALVRNYVKGKFPQASKTEIIEISNQLIMSTASTVYDENHLAYSPRKQGAGLANLKNIVETNAYAFTTDQTTGYYEGRDGRPKVELGEDEGKKGVYSFNFKVRNFGSDPLTFTPQALFMTEELDSEKVAVAERAHMFGDVNPVFSVGGSPVEKFTVSAGDDVTLEVTLTLSDAEKKYLDDSFKNGMYVEGFIKLVCETEGQCDINVPFLGFYGDWESAPMLDYTAFEIAEFEQDSSILEEQKPSETVWATQAYSSYNHDKYVIPIGSFVYNLGDDADPMYADMEHCAISRFDDVVSDEGLGNYVTAYNIRCVYAGLLRNAKKITYELRDSATGEVIVSGVKNRVSKAYANGGSARPAYLELQLSAEELALMSNGKYTMDFYFQFNDAEISEKNKFSFDFYVDYEAPVLQDARLRYYNTTDSNGKDTQKIYLDLDVYDNHYAQSIMLCYIDTEDEKQEMKLATEYVTPVRNANKNGTTTVSIDVTDIWDKYKDVLAVQVDDYALNHTSYILRNLNSSVDIETSFNRDVLPDSFDLAEGEENITLGINEMHKVSLVYEGSADPSNFGWSSPTHYIDVKNGEIVGRKSTNGKAYPVMVTNHKGVSKIINVTVTDTVKSVSGLSFSFGPIVNADESLQKAEGTVRVYAGEDIQLEVLPTPWYFNGETTITWDSGKPDVATVTDNGLVHTKKKGSSIIRATVTANGINYFVNVNLNVLDEFTVSNMSLTRYRGEGETINGEDNVVIFPSDLNVMTIGEDAFRDNKVIKKVIIPKTVTQIDANAFKGCTALEKVYFLSDDEADYTQSGFVADADLTLINRNAFEGCTALQLLDLRYTKVFTIAREAFKDCISLKTIVKSTAIGTAYDRAFAGCESLESINISGLHVAGANVFSGCTALNDVTTDKFTAIGAGMFGYVKYPYQKYDYTTGEWETVIGKYEACTSLNEIIIRTSTVRDNAFMKCTSLTKVTFDGVADARIGSSAFESCENLATVELINGSTFKSIGANAFANTKWSNGNDAIISDNTLVAYLGNQTGAYALPAGITVIAPYAFANSKITSIDLSDITEIGEGAFSGSNLQSVTFGNALTSVGSSAFRNTELTSVALPQSVKYVGDYAFAETSVSTFDFAPDNQAEFGSGVFYGCKSLSTVTLGANLKTMGDRTFEGCSALKSAELPALTSLGGYTFWNTPALTTVSFKDGATTIGTYTFAAQIPESRIKFTSFTMPATVQTVGEGAFYNCSRLGAIDLTAVRTVGNYAFYNCNLLEAEGLSSLENIGDYAFYNNNRLGSLNLANAKKIGDGAFMITSGRAYTEVSFPVAENIGKFAFYGGNEKTINIPATLVAKVNDDYITDKDYVEVDGKRFGIIEGIGDGAFAASPSLTEFTVASGNTSYIVKDGVLYRKISDSTFALVAFPSAKSVDEFEVADGTVTVEGHSFRGLYGKVKKVILPYSLKTVGAMAFYKSGITVYEFKGVTAPALEEEYSEFVDAYFEAGNQNIKGYYNANFEDYFVYYSEAGTGENVTPLTIYRPTNGTGYDNRIYSRYFANTQLTGITTSADTYSFIQFVDGCPDASEISGWTTADKTKEQVAAFSEQVKRAHEYYNNFVNDSEQVALAGNARIDKFLAVETALRGIKPAFGIKVTVARLSAAGDFRTEYKVGEKFDMTGLKVIIEYDDYSTAEANMADVTLVSPTGELNELHNEVQLSLKGFSNSLRIRINVTEDGKDKKIPEDGGCGCALNAGMSFAAIAAMGLTVAIIAVSRKKDRGIK